MQVTEIIHMADDALKKDDDNRIYELIKRVENYQFREGESRKYSAVISKLRDMIEIIQDVKVEAWITMLKESE
tara:strand:+ start:282 stop:500 length:219 start_codon:yes stop_codon:yes gene_type:complete